VIRVRSFRNLLIAEVMSFPGLDVSFIRNSDSSLPRTVTSCGACFRSFCFLLAGLATLRYDNATLA
jgi:hypothetical protein